jgi:hypothetical protein
MRVRIDLEPMTRLDGWLYVLAVILGIALGILAGAFGPQARADDICGANMNWDWQHQICQPGAPVPYPPVITTNPPIPSPWTVR